jgi:hypothetical protein
MTAALMIFIQPQLIAQGGPMCMSHERSPSIIIASSGMPNNTNTKVATAHPE